MTAARHGVPVDVARRLLSVYLSLLSEGLAAGEPVPLGHLGTLRWWKGKHRHTSRFSLGPHSRTRQIWNPGPPTPRGPFGVIRIAAEGPPPTMMKPIGSFMSPNLNSDLKKSFGINTDTAVDVIRLTSVKGVARKFYLPGDYLVRYPEVEERYSEIIRPNADIYFVHGMHRGYPPFEVDQDLVDGLRGRSIENRIWSWHRDGGHLVIIDPYGRAIVWRQEKAWFLYGKIMEQIVHFAKGRGSPADVPVYRQIAAKLTMKAVHRRLMTEVNGVVDWCLVYKTEMLAKNLYKLALRCRGRPYQSRELRLVRIRGRFGRPFWARVARMYEKGVELPRPMQILGKHTKATVVKISPQELEQVLAFAAWPEWDTGVSPIRVYRARVGEEVWQ